MIKETASTLGRAIFSSFRHFQMSVSSAAAADSGVYVCLVVNSLVDLDKTFRYNSAVVTVSGRETGTDILYSYMLSLLFLKCCETDVKFFTPCGSPPLFFFVFWFLHLLLLFHFLLFG